MSRISMRGYGKVEELCETLPKRLDDACGTLMTCEVLECARHGPGASLLLDYHGVLTLAGTPIAVSIFADGQCAIVDVITRSPVGAMTTLYSDKPVLFVAKVLRELGFEDYERGSWHLEADARAEEKAADEAENNAPVSTSSLTQLIRDVKEQELASRRDTGTQSELIPAEREPSKRRRGKRSYDPEI